MKIGIARILGNDLDEVHGKGQTVKNLKFTLENENLGENVEYIYFLNRIVDKSQKYDIVALLKKHKKKYVNIPFDIRKFRKMYGNFYLRLAYHNALVKYKTIDKYNYRKIAKTLMQYNLYLINNNGSRNYALNYMKKNSKAEWLFILDSNSYFTRKDFDNIISKIEKETEYLIIPTIKVDTFNLMQGEDYFSELRGNYYGEGSIAFHKNSKLNFNERIPYGASPKAELLRVMDVTNSWEEWIDNENVHIMMEWNKWIDNVKTYNIPDREKVKVKWQILPKILRLSTYNSNNNMKNNQINRVKGIICLIKKILSKKNIII